MPRVTAAKREECVQRYLSGESSSSVGSSCGLSRQAVLGLVHRRGGIVRDAADAARTQTLNQAFFANIDTESKAYWLGFINADGCVQAGPVGTAGWQRHSLSVKLKASDAGHLEGLSDRHNACRQLINFIGLILVESIVRRGQ